MKSITSPNPATKKHLKLFEAVRLSRVNNLLLALIIIVDGYIIVAPLFPSLSYAWQNHQGKQQTLQRKLEPTKSSSFSNSYVTQANQIIVPSMLLDQPILEGSIVNQYKTLNKGIWRWPKGSTPDKGGNTILIGHRFTYTNPRGVFYFLNKVKIGDNIGVIWNHAKYVYKVTSINQIPPTDTSVENQTTQSELTLFTCTPLLLPKDRLVVVANLETKS